MVKLYLQMKYLLMDHAYFLIIHIIDMHMMTDIEEFRLHKIFWIAIFIVDIIRIRPRKYALLYH